MKQDNNDKLYNEYLDAVQGLRPAETDPFFYGRLRAKLESRNEHSYISFFRPGLLAISLVVLLILNVWVAFNYTNTVTETDTLKQVASEYNLTVQSTY